MWKELQRRQISLPAEIGGISGMPNVVNLEERGFLSPKSGKIILC